MKQTMRVFAMVAAMALCVSGAAYPARDDQGRSPCRPDRPYGGSGQAVRPGRPGLQGLGQQERRDQRQADRHADVRLRLRQEQGGEPVQEVHRRMASSRSRGGAPVTRKRCPRPPASTDPVHLRVVLGHLTDPKKTPYNFFCAPTTPRDCGRVSST